PDCNYAVWNEPIAGPCPKCQWPILTVKTTKRRGTEKVCPQKECDYAEPYEGGGEETPPESTGTAKAAKTVKKSKASVEH
ncbi:MAG TPA: hypothetical protein VKA13_03275, partial [Gammaproteobacteria bacterium]|nr:hypothetical protein [Gammaproteobacteria bacterium]